MAFSSLSSADDIVLYTDEICSCHPRDKDPIEAEWPTTRFVLSDFGIARPFDNGESKKYTGQRQCTIDYAPPEFDDEYSVYSGGSDIWAFGCLLFRVCAHNQYIPENTSASRSRRISWRDLFCNRDGPPHLNKNSWTLHNPNLLKMFMCPVEKKTTQFVRQMNAIIAACLARNRKERPSALDLLQRFESIRDNINARYREAEEGGHVKVLWNAREGQQAPSADDVVGRC